jgi:hypothetical protein
MTSEELKPRSRTKHSGRASGAQHAEQLGATLEMIKRLLRANNNRMIQSYLSQIPVNPIRVMSGFGDKPGFYYLPRALVILPISLQKMVFPDVEKWLPKVLENDHNPLSNSCVGFLQLLIELRVVLLQDAVFLRYTNLDNALLQDPVFKSQEFVCKDLNEAMDTMPTHSAIPIETAMTHVYVEIQTLCSELVMSNKKECKDLNVR